MPAKRKAAALVAVASKRTRVSSRLAAAASRAADAAAAAGAAADGAAPTPAPAAANAAAAAAAAAAATAVVSKRGRSRKAPAVAAAAASSSSAAAAAELESGDAKDDAPAPAAGAGAGAAAAAAGAGAATGMVADASVARSGTGPILRWADVGNGHSATAPATTYACSGSLRGFKATSKPVVDFVASLQSALEAVRDPVLGARQCGYMRSLFPFVGLQQPARLAASTPVIRAHTFASEAHVAEAAKALWALPEREYQYNAIDVLTRHRALWSPALLVTVEELLRNKSWWDTVDPLSAAVVGELVRAFPDLQSVMQRWLSDPYLWLRRSALLHQLRFKAATDAQKLFRFIDATKHESDFFIRKSIGWALREYSKTDKSAVRKYIDANAHTLSALSIKEGSKYC